jgi:phosphoribosylformylglycinamidine cyclo-ligase
MEIYVAPEVADAIIAISKSYNVNAQIVGSVAAAETKKMTIKSPYGVFEY